MKAQIKLFRVFGIQIGLNYSWLLIAVLGCALTLLLPAPASFNLEDTTN